jgi:hypothetical protein
LKGLGTAVAVNCNDADDARGANRSPEDGARGAKAVATASVRKRVTSCDFILWFDNFNVGILSRYKIEAAEVNDNYIVIFEILQLQLLCG